jgi:hypothetical protein
MVTYTTAVLVRSRTQRIDTANLTDAGIESLILMVEGVIDATMKESFRDPNRFNANKHGLIQDAATNLAAFYSVLYSQDEFADQNCWRTTLNHLWNRWQENFALLANQDVVKFLLSM